MGLTLSSLKLWATFNLWNKTEARILMVGLDAAGKTTILYKLRLGEVVTTIPTIGFNVEPVEYVTANGSKLSLTVWDIGGQDRIRNLWRYYFNNTDAIIFVVDSNDVDRLDVAREEVSKLLAADELRDAGLLVLANKQDLPHAMAPGDLATKLALHEYRGREWYIQGCSATTGDGLHGGLEWVASFLQRRTATAAKR